MNINWTKMLLIATIVVLTSGFAQDKAIAAQTASTITVQGSSEFDIIPDQAEISISVVNTAPTANEAQNDNAKVASNVQHKLLSLGISKDNIRTAQYNVYPIYDNETDKTVKKQTISGYHIANTITATLDDITTVGNVIDAALSAGADQISNIHFRKKDELPMKQAVLQGAVKEATAKAEAIASALNKHITGVLSVNESGVSVERTQLSDQSYGLRSKLALSANTPISPGTIQIHGSVNIVFEIQ